MPPPFPLSLRLGALAGGLDCFPFDNEAYTPLSDSQALRRGIRSLVGFGRRVSPLAHSVLYPLSFCLRLALKLFRGEPAISRFDWPFTPIHSSSKQFSTYTGSDLHGGLAPLHPGHG